MLIGRIEKQTRELGAPPGWDDEKQGRCGSLPIRDDRDAGVPTMTSAWVPTPAEILAIVAGASIHLTIWGNGHPPVGLSVGNPVDAINRRNPGPFLDRAEQIAWEIVDYMNVIRSSLATQQDVPAGKVCCEVWLAGAIATAIRNGP